MDLRQLNLLFHPTAIHFESLNWLAHNAPRDTIAGASLDLADGYFHLKVHPTLRRLMRFNINGEEYECTALPMGWSLAPYAFTRVMRVLISAIRAPASTNMPSWL